VARRANFGKAESPVVRRFPCILMAGRNVTPRLA